MRLGEKMRRMMAMTMYAPVRYAHVAVTEDIVNDSLNEYQLF